MARRSVFRSSLVALAVAAVFQAASPAQAREETIAFTGMPAPGVPGASFVAFAAPSLNNAGDIALFSVLQGSVTFANDSALYRNGTLVFREGDSAGAGLTFGGLISVPLINEAGQTLIRAALLDPATGEGAAVVRDGTVLLRTRIQAPGIAAGGQISLLFREAMNNAGTVVASAGFTGTGITSSNDSALYRIAPNGATSLIAREGNGAPGGGIFASFGIAAINDLGQVAFRAVVSDTAPTAVIYRDSAVIARQGDAAPGLSGVTLSGLNEPRMNNTGQVAFSSTLGGTATADNNAAVWRDTTLIARKGNFAPGAPSGTTFLSFGTPLLNDAGQVAYFAQLTDTSGEVRGALYRNSTLMARTGTAVPGEPAGSVLTDVSMLDFNNGGQVLYLGTIVPAAGPAREALRLSDGVETVEVVRSGETRLGKTIDSFFLNSAQPQNDHGQVAYQVFFADASSSRGVFLYTPELRWRQGFSGSWDSAGNWTLGINPAHPHDVKIDPSVSITVTGPSTDRTVRTLEIGGGNGIAALSLLGGKITALDAPVRIRGTGVLTGDGSIAGGVLNQGTVRAQNVTIAGGLTNEGLITGNGRLSADTISNTTGRISVTSGQALELGGFLVNGPLGKIDVIQGAFELRGGLINEGQLLARGATLRTADGLGNFGRLDIGPGITDVFGRVSNASGATVVVSGGGTAIFADDFANGGVVRASTGSSIVYFGDVTGAGSFLGAGMHFFEGSTSPGSSPGTLTLENAVLGSSHELRMELRGAAEGQYDHVHALGHLELGGALMVSLLDGFAPLAGHEFDLLDWGTLGTGRFSSIVLPGLGTNLAWVTSDLYFDGTISVAAIPEPETWALLLAGLGLLGFAARRKNLS